VQTFKKVDKLCTAYYTEFYTNQEVDLKSTDRDLLVPPFTVLTYYGDFHEIQNFSLKFSVDISCTKYKPIQQ